jgi:hypothetical protein
VRTMTLRADELALGTIFLADVTGFLATFTLEDLRAFFGLVVLGVLVWRAEPARGELEIWAAASFPEHSRKRAQEAIRAMARMDTDLGESVNGAREGLPPPPSGSRRGQLQLPVAGPCLPPTGEG